VKWIWLLLILPLAGYAEECSQINYLTQPNSPFDKIPVGDQDGAGICYAFSAAQLMDYHLIKTGQTRERVMHPAWVALKSSRRILYSGQESDGVNAMRQVGSCGYDRVEQSLNAFGMSGNLSGAPLVNFIETYARELNRLSRDRAASTDIQDAAYDKAVDETYPHCPEDVRFDPLIPAVRELTGTSVQIFNHLLADTCPPSDLRRYNIPAPVNHEIPIDVAAAKAKLNQNITNGPHAIGYCAIAWEKKNGLNSQGVANDDCGAHSSLAVGRKMIDGYCHTLVRNTWGTGWGDWNQNSVCVCRNKRTGEWVDGCNYYLHTEDEYTVEACYIGQNLLSRNLFSITTLGP
jgi:hypothetical protein